MKQIWNIITALGPGLIGCDDLTQFLKCQALGDQASV